MTIPDVVVGVDGSAGSDQAISENGARIRRDALRPARQVDETGARCWSYDTDRANDPLAAVR
jgi:hypothetical protein